MASFSTTARFDLVICDIDGCLAPEGPEPMDLANLAEVAAHNRLALARRDRPLVTVCSGRPLPFAEAMCRLLQNTTLPCVAENGVWLYHPGTNEYLIDPAITAENRDAVYQASRLLAELYADQGVTQQPGKSASVTLYHPDTNYLRSIAPAVEEALHARGWPFRVSMTLLYINCDLAHVSKASGIARLLTATGITGGRAAGIGDTLSDRAIAESVAFFGCPANAVEEVRPWARYVSSHAEAAGVVDILRRLALE
jgi:hydroxymethylpyrimidine pyrophosphatase-like HAD family hydrolase